MPRSPMWTDLSTHCWQGRIRRPPSAACVLHAIETLWDNEMSKRKSTKVITERAVRRAFARVLRKPEELEAAVATFMSGNPVPPAWGLGGVREVLGRAVSRMWARHLRHLRGAYFLNPDTNRSLFPVVQHKADLDMDARRRWRQGHRPPVNLAPRVTIVLDEAWPLLNDPQYVDFMQRTVLSPSNRRDGNEMIDTLLKAMSSSGH